MHTFDIVNLLNLMPLNIYWKDKNGKYLGCNLAQAHFFGLQDPTQIIGKTDLEIASTPELAKLWMENDQKVIHDGVPLITEETAVINNKKITGLSCKIPFRDGSDNVAGIMGITIDITAQKSVEKKLEQEKRDAQIALENIIARLPGHVYWMDRDNKFLGCNDLQAKSAGLNSRYDIIGKTNNQMPWFAIADIINSINNKVMETGQEYTEEQEAQLADGTKRTFFSKKAPLLDEAGHVVGILGISFDITDRKQMEEELIHAKNKAESANRTKTEFLANMSHDMKTPLTGVVGMADLMAHDLEARNIDRQRAQSIYACGLQAVSLFDSCLELSKMEMQEWESKTEIFSLKKLLEDIQALFVPKAQIKNLSFVLDYDHALPDRVEGHRESLYRVLLNLVGNAIKFTEQGSVTVRAKLVNALVHEPVTVELQVQDTGIGIPEDKHQIIFEKFHRLTPSYEGKIEGSGIGLYVVNQYVKHMDGVIHIDSNIGQGSTFAVTLPLKRIHDTKENASARTLSEEKLSPNNRKILLVEDHPMIQMITKKLLMEIGLIVDTASTGQEALNQFSPEKYSLIYMDIGLPDMDGYAVTATIRQQEKAQHATTTPILALTAHAMHEVKEQCEMSGMQGALSKPLTRQQAEQLWARFGEHQAVEVNGLVVL